MKTKLAIAIPTTGTIKTKTVACLARMTKNLPFDYHILLDEGSMLHVMRERMVQKAWDLKCTHLLFIDSDMHFNADDVLKLLKRKKAVIGAPYNCRKLPLQTTVKNPKDMSKTLTTCDAVGTGFMLIDLSVLRDLNKPWFFWGENGESEDYWFCRQVREAGHKVWVDLSVPVGHLGDYLY